MYGYSGYGTNTYASRRLTILGPIVDLSMRTLILGTAPLIQPFSVVQSSYGYQLPFTLEDGNGNPVNLTNALLVINVQDSQDASDELLFSGSMTIDSALAGTCHYTVAQGNFPNPGTFLVQIVATWSGTEQLTWTGVKIIVEPQLPKSNN